MQQGKAERSWRRPGDDDSQQIAQQLAPPAREAQVLADVLALVEHLRQRGLLTVTMP